MLLNVLKVNNKDNNDVTCHRFIVFIVYFECIQNINLMLLFITLNTFYILLTIYSCYPSKKILFTGVNKMSVLDTVLKLFTLNKYFLWTNSAQQSAQLTYTCSNSTIKTLKKGVRYVKKLTIKTLERHQDNFVDFEL